MFSAEHCVDEESAVDGPAVLVHGLGESTCPGSQHAPATTSAGAQSATNQNRKPLTQSPKSPKKKPSSRPGKRPSKSKKRPAGKSKGK